MDTLQGYINAHVQEELGEDPSEHVGTRVTHAPEGTGKLWWEVELDIYNGHVTYTRVSRFGLDNGEMKSKALTMKTRLHVPIQEVPKGATVYLPDGSGPFTYIAQDEIDGEPLYMLFRMSHVGIGVILNNDDYVSVEFYYAKGEGAVAGGVLMCPELYLREWADWVLYPDGLKTLVEGCKFDMWSVSYGIQYKMHGGIAKLSVFNLPKAKES